MQDCTPEHFRKGMKLWEAKCQEIEKRRAEINHTNLKFRTKIRWFRIHGETGNCEVCCSQNGKVYRANGYSSHDGHDSHRIVYKKIRCMNCRDIE